MTALETLLTRADVICNTMEASVVASGVLVLDDDDELDGFNKYGLESEVAVS